MSGHPVVTFYRELHCSGISMDAGYRIHEVSRTVDCLVLVPSSNEPVFCMLPIHSPYSAAGYDVPLNDGYKGGAVTLGDQLHKEVASSRVHGAEHPLRRDSPCAAIRRRLRPCNDSFVHGDDTSWPSQLNRVVEEVP